MAVRPEAPILVGRGEDDVEGGVVVARLGLLGDREPARERPADLDRRRSAVVSKLLPQAPAALVRPPGPPVADAGAGDDLRELVQILLAERAQRDAGAPEDR